MMDANCSFINKIFLDLLEFKVGFQYCDADRVDFGFIERRCLEYENAAVRRKHSASWSIP